MVLSCASSAEGSSRSSVGVASGGGHTPSQGEGPADSTQCVRVLFSPYSDWSSTGVCVCACACVFKPLSPQTRELRCTQCLFSEVVGP